MQRLSHTNHITQDINLTELVPVKVYDQLRRPMRDLRISVIDQCNFRCSYCMPKGKENLFRFVGEEDRLSYAELLRLVKVLSCLGIQKVRLTGGEPLLRPRLPAFIKQLSQLGNIQDIALTTNGSFLGEYVQDLKSAGLSRITLSLDSVNPEKFKRITAQKETHLKHIFYGIQAAGKAGFTPLKINVVLQNGLKEKDILDTVRYFRGSGHIVRFIEFMDVGHLNAWKLSRVIPTRDIYRLIHDRYPLIPIEPNYKGEVATRYRYADAAGEIGLISAVSNPFCGDCHRLRLSSEGFLFSCLYASQHLNLRRLLRTGRSDQEIYQAIRVFWEQRDDRYSLNRQKTASSKSYLNSREMYQIGG